MGYNEGVDKETAPQVRKHPEARTTKGDFMDTTTVAHPAREATPTREKGTCSGCGTTTKTLTAPISNARDYEGPMYCLSCNPRFLTLDMHYSSLERLGA